MEWQGRRHRQLTQLTVASGDDEGSEGFRSSTDYVTGTEDEFMTGDEDMIPSSPDAVSFSGDFAFQPITTTGDDTVALEEEAMDSIEPLDSTISGSGGLHVSASSEPEPPSTPDTPTAPSLATIGKPSAEAYQPSPRRRSAHWSRVASLKHLISASRHFTGCISMLKVGKVVRSTLQHSDEKIQVFVRVRPFNDREKQLHDEGCVRTTDTEVFVTPEGQDEEHQFTYDNVFGPDSTQADLYETVMFNPMAKYLAGFNVCIFAYGQTGSGKTWTMIGDNTTPETLGIVPRAIRQIFDYNTEANNVIFKITASVVEIYNESLRDLLTDSDEYRLEIREDKTRGVFVRNLTEEEVESPEEAAALLDRAATARITGETNMNARSSRSHMVFSLHLEQRDADDRLGYSKKTSVMNLVDLAGSERAKATGAKGTRLKEGAAINLSLTNLGAVINSLVKKGRGEKVHVPFRNSKLTRLLQNSLGGNSSTIMMANASPAAVNASEIVSTLRFADRAKQVQNKAKVNYDPQAQLVIDLTEENKRLKAEIEKLKSCIEVEKTRSMLLRLDSNTSLDEATLRQRLAELEEKHRDATEKAAEADHFRSMTPQPPDEAQAKTQALNLLVGQLREELSRAAEQHTQDAAALASERSRSDALVREVEELQEEQTTHAEESVKMIQKLEAEVLQYKEQASKLQFEATQSQDTLEQLQQELVVTEQGRQELAEELRAMNELDMSGPMSPEQQPAPAEKDPTPARELSDWEVIQQGMQLASSNTANETNRSSSRRDLMQGIEAMKSESKALRMYIDRMLAIIIDRCPEVLERK